MATAISGEPVPVSLLVIDPNGHRARVALNDFPFKIGRQADNHFVLRDSRSSRNHAQIVREDGGYVVEDTNSRHGVYVNGAKVARHTLKNHDRIEFGFSDSYQLHFSTESPEAAKMLEQFPGAEQMAKFEGIAGAPGPASSLAKLRAVLEVARALEASLSTNEVLTSVVGAALSITGAERGFLLLRKGDGLDMVVARDRHGSVLAENDLRVPRSLIHRALRQRRELLSMNFDPLESQGAGAERSIADLELRSVVCVPLVKIRTGEERETTIMSAENDTLGVLYLDSRAGSQDLSSGNRELIQTLALEASTILENARLLTEQRASVKLEEELTIARQIQQGLLPRELPSTGWFRANGSSLPTHQVGGDYFDVAPIDGDNWAVVVADVSGKGVSSALLASLLQGAFLIVSDSGAAIGRRFERLNQFLAGRTQGEKYATVLYATLSRGGTLSYVNAAHCAPVLVHPDGRLEELETTGMPVGLIPEATWDVAEKTLLPGSKMVIYSDGVTEAHDQTGEFFGMSRLLEAISECAGESCEMMHGKILERLESFTGGAEQADDITLVVVEFHA
ncbi:MAG: FHA domain-containing protein [Bryobacterales bacterium]|nr:FHA domain-containing protein [Bryobacterales bacterium]